MIKAINIKGAISLVVKSLAKVFLWLLILMLFLSGLYWWVGGSDMLCLDKFAQAHCKTLNMSHRKISAPFKSVEIFRCDLKDERSESFYDYKFLDSERKQCCTKLVRTFKRGCD